MNRPNDKIHWLTEEQYQKAVSQLRMNVAGALHPLRMYGQGEFVDEAVDIIVSLSEDFGLRVRGVDIPISFDLVYKNRRQKE